MTTLPTCRDVRAMVALGNSRHRPRAPKMTLLAHKKRGMVQFDAAVRFIGFSVSCERVYCHAYPASVLSGGSDRARGAAEPHEDAR